MKIQERPHQAADPIGRSGTAPLIAKGRPVKRMSEQLFAKAFAKALNAPAAFLFIGDDLFRIDHARHRQTGPLHDDVMRAQARLLATIVTTLPGVLAIDDIYAHPLIRQSDILSGHRLRAFIGAPLQTQPQGFFGVICAVDTLERRWDDQEIGITQQIVAQLETHRLSQS